MNIPSGLKEASNVELHETGVTLYVDNYVKIMKTITQKASQSSHKSRDRTKK